MVPTEATVSMATPLGSLKYTAFWGLFSGSGKGSSVGGKECSVVSQDKSSAEWRSRQLVRASTEAWQTRSSGRALGSVCGGGGQRRRLFQILLIGEGFMIFTMCLVPCVCSETQTKEGKGEFICF